mmetsp:Transcript_374/g.1249  ORF Transcript_374/g.1249 Transcript_374/m.1249 type:complete len:1397 (+) Transcript_374:32-4222(+)|eukprot:scaffold112_cov282-Prasinococcus_capsulatus_cf.AAC.8
MAQLQQLLREELLAAEYEAARTQESLQQRLQQRAQQRLRGNPQHDDSSTQITEGISVPVNIGNRIDSLRPVQPTSASSLDANVRENVCPNGTRQHGGGNCRSLPAQQSGPTQPYNLLRMSSAQTLPSIKSDPVYGDRYPSNYQCPQTASAQYFPPHTSGREEMNVRSSHIETNSPLAHQYFHRQQSEPLYGDQHAQQSVLPPSHSLPREACYPPGDEGSHEQYCHSRSDEPPVSTVFQDVQPLHECHQYGFSPQQQPTTTHPLPSVDVYMHNDHLQYVSENGTAPPVVYGHEDEPRPSYEQPHSDHHYEQLQEQHQYESLQTRQPATPSPVVLLQQHDSCLYDQTAPYEPRRQSHEQYVGTYGQDFQSSVYSHDYAPAQTPEVSNAAFEADMPLQSSTPLTAEYFHSNYDPLTAPLFEDGQATHMHNPPKNCGPDYIVEDVDEQLEGIVAYQEPAPRLEWFVRVRNSVQLLLWRYLQCLLPYWILIKFARHNNSIHKTSKPDDPDVYELEAGTQYGFEDMELDHGLHDGTYAVPEELCEGPRSFSQASMDEGKSTLKSTKTKKGSEKGKRTKEAKKKEGKSSPTSKGADMPTSIVSSSTRVKSGGRVKQTTSRKKTGRCRKGTHSKVYGESELGTDDYSLGVKGVAKEQDRRLPHLPGSSTNRGDTSIAAKLKQRGHILLFVVLAIFYFNWELQAGMLQDYQFSLQMINDEVAHISSGAGKSAVASVADLEEGDDTEGLEDKGNGSTSGHVATDEVRSEGILDITNEVEAGPGERTVEVHLLGATKQKAKYNFQAATAFIPTTGEIPNDIEVRLKSTGERFLWRPWNMEPKLKEEDAAISAASTVKGGSASDHDPVGHASSEAHLTDSSDPLSPPPMLSTANTGSAYTQFDGAMAAIDKVSTAIIANPVDEDGGLVGDRGRSSTIQNSLSIQEHPSQGLCFNNCDEWVETGTQELCGCFKSCAEYGNCCSDNSACTACGYCPSKTSSSGQDALKDPLAEDYPSGALFHNAHEDESHEHTRSSNMRLEATQTTGSPPDEDIFDSSGEVDVIQVELEPVKQLEIGEYYCEDVELHQVPQGGFKLCGIFYRVGCAKPPCLKRGARTHWPEPVIDKRYFLDDTVEIQITDIFVSELQPFVEDFGIVVDVGSNIGYYSLLSASLRWPSYAIDVQPLCAQHVVTSSYENSLDSLIHAFNLALVDGMPGGSSPSAIERQMMKSDRCKAHFSATMDLDAQYYDHEGSHDEDDETEEEWQAVPKLTFDSFKASHIGEATYIKILKVDVDGEEINFLLGALHTLRKAQIENLIFHIKVSQWQASGISAARGIQLLERLRDGYEQLFLLEEKSYPRGSLVYELNTDSLPSGVRGPLYTAPSVKKLVLNRLELGLDMTWWLRGPQARV